MSKRRVSVDPRTFDEIVRRLAGSATRRSVLAGSVLTALGLGEAALAKKQGRADAKTTVTAEACIPSGKKCPAKRPRGKKGKKLGCDKCCQGFTQPNPRGGLKCACKPNGQACSSEGAAQCCTATCTNGVCANAGPEPCSAIGVSCTANAQCCIGICNVGGSDIGPINRPNPGTANKCAFCLTGGATCDPNSFSVQCCSFPGCDPTTNRCCSVAGETCTPTGSTATVPAQGTCCRTGDRCPVAGNVGTANVCCTASGQVTPASNVCGSGGNTGQGCCTGQCR